MGLEGMSYVEFLTCVFEGLELEIDLFGDEAECGVPLVCDCDV